jgi:hypothetical protein
VLAWGESQRGIKAAAGVMKNTDPVYVNTHSGDGIAGTGRRNKMDRRSHAGIRWKLNGYTCKRCSNQQQHESTQAHSLFRQFCNLFLFWGKSEIEFKDASTLLPQKKACNSKWTGLSNLHLVVLRNHDRNDVAGSSAERRASGAQGSSHAN